MSGISKPGRLFAGSSGFGYASWKPDFYPRGTKPGEFLRLYAERLPTVELNATGRRLPDPTQLERWASMTPPAFRFSVKLTTWIPARPETAARFTQAVATLGERLGAVLVQLPAPGRHDGPLLERLAAKLDPELRYAIELKDDAWDGERVLAACAPLRAVLVGQTDPGPGFCYFRLREPPYDETQLATLVSRITPALAAGADAFAYFRHEDEPTAPRYAAQLMDLARSAA